MTVVQIARAAGSDDADGIAAVAGVEVTQALGELDFEGTEPLDLLARFVELGHVHFAHEAHRRRSRRLCLPLADDGLDVGEREAELLELADPPDANEGVGTKEPVTPLGASQRDEQPELFVQVDGADRLVRRLRQVADLQDVGLVDLGLLAGREAQPDRERGTARRRGGLGRRNQGQVAGGRAHGSEERVLSRTLT